MNSKAPVLSALCLLWAAGAASAAPAQPAQPQGQPTAPTASGAAQPAQPSALTEGRERATEIVTQPVRDVGVSKPKIPPPLAKAVDTPYGLDGLKTCRQLAHAITELNEVLGSDFQAGTKYHENHAVRLAEAGGKAVVNSFIPFRGIVREVSGAAPAARRHDAATSMGYARRGFLRGVYLQRRCKPAY